MKVRVEYDERYTWARGFRRRVRANFTPIVAAPRIGAVRGLTRRSRAQAERDAQLLRQVPA